MGSKNWNKETFAVNREEAKPLAKEFQYVWTRDVLLQCGMNIEDCFPEEDDPDQMTVEQKIELRKILRTNDIIVLDDRDNGVKIYLDEQVIGEWKKPYYVLHEDRKKIDPKDKLYTCVHIQYWSYFDGEEIEEEEYEDDEEYEYEYEDE